MDYAWRILLAVIGLGILRRSLYQKQWDHGGFFAKVIGLAIALGLMAPLINYNFQTGSLILLIAGVIVLPPYGRIFIARLRATARKGLRKLGDELEAGWIEDRSTGLMAIVREQPAGNGYKLWAGNALTHVRSLHPGVKTNQTYYMLAYVVKLDNPPPFLCSLMKGWTSPKYFEREWRQDSTMQGGMFAMNLGGTLNEGWGEGAPEGIETGGKTSDLSDYVNLDHEKFSGFFAIKGTHQQLFEAVFKDDLLEKFFATAYQGAIQFECNVTPRSVNIHSIYCGYEGQKKHIDFLQKLATAIDGFAGH